MIIRGRRCQRDCSCGEVSGAAVAEAEAEAAAVIGDEATNTGAFRDRP